MSLLCCCLQLPAICIDFLITNHRHSDVRLRHQFTVIPYLPLTDRTLLRKDRPFIREASHRHIALRGDVYLLGHGSPAFSRFDLPFHGWIVFEQPIGVSYLLIYWHIPGSLARTLVHAVDSNRIVARCTDDLKDRVKHSLIG